MILKRQSGSSPVKSVSLFLFTYDHVEPEIVGSRFLSGLDSWDTIICTVSIGRWERDSATGATTPLQKQPGG
jgi:hypothetical protein